MQRLIAPIAPASAALAASPGTHAREAVVVWSRQSCEMALVEKPGGPKWCKAPKEGFAAFAPAAAASAFQPAPRGWCARATRRRAIEITGTSDTSSRAHFPGSGTTAKIAPPLTSTR